MARLRRGPTVKKKTETCETSNNGRYAQIDYARRWLIGIDIGTTQLYVGYKRPGSNEEFSVDGYNAYDCYVGDGALIPTDLYYPADGSQPRWGRLTKMDQTTGRNYDPRRLVRFWKPAIHETQDDSWYHNELKSQAMYIFGIPDVSKFARDFFKLLFDFLFLPDRGYFYKSEIGFRIELASVVLSKPSGWPQSEYLVFQDAAEAWGLKRQISFISETDGLALSWLRREAKRREGFKPGFSMVVVDWGGGTVNIDALEISHFDRNEPENIQVRPSGILPSSLRHGSETSLEHFAKHMHSRFSSTGYPTEKIGAMVNAAVFQFSQLKNGFRLDQGSDPWFLNIAGVPGGAVALEQNEIRQQFEPSVKATIDAIDDIVEKLQVSRAELPEVIIIGGGGSTFPYFFDSLVERYERSGSSTKIAVQRVQDFKRGVVKGAIHLRQHTTGFMKYSLSRESYAIPCRIEDVTGADRERMLALYPGLTSKLNKTDGRFYFPTPVLQWFIKEGDVVGPNIVIRPDDDSGIYGMRQAEIIRKSDLCFEEHLVIYRGHPGPDNWTPYDSQRMNEEKYRIEKLVVDLRHHIDPKDLPRMNLKKGNSNRRVRRLDYDYSSEFEGETPSYFVQFKKPGEDTPVKLRVHTTRIDLATLEAHQNLSRNKQLCLHHSDVLSADDDSSKSFFDMGEPSLSSDTSSVPVPLQLKSELQQRISEPAETTSSVNQQNTETKKPSNQPIDTTEHDTSSTILLQHNAPESLPMEKNYTRKVALQYISNQDPAHVRLRPQITSSIDHMTRQTLSQEQNLHLHNPIMEENFVAFVHNKSVSGSILVKGDAEDSADSMSLDGKHEAIPGFPYQSQSRAPRQTETQTSPISKAVGPSRRITRQAISRVLTAVSPNVRRRKGLFANVGEYPNATSEFGGRPKGSLLPIPSKRRRPAVDTGSNV